MKKIFVILLLMMYGASSFGMTVHFHYCCGKLKNIDFTPPNNIHCGKTHQMGSKPCCDSKKVEIKITDEQNPAKVYYPAFDLDAIKPIQQDYFVSSPFENKNLLPETFAPPPKTSQHLYVLNCVFRIWFYLPLTRLLCNGLNFFFAFYNTAIGITTNVRFNQLKSIIWNRL